VLMWLCCVFSIGIFIARGLALLFGCIMVKDGVSKFYVVYKYATFG